MNRIEINSLKERIDLVRVVDHYLSLEKKGNVYMALCPFHDDRHPSLRVDPEKGLYHCFSCGAGGDVFRFVQEKEGCGFGEAIRLCADICHFPVPALDAGSQKHRPDKQQTPAPTVEMNERYRQTLLPYDPGMEELRETYAAFEVGIAPAIVPEAWKFTRGRLIFPIRNAAGELVAFAARYRGDLSAKKIPKYINSSTSVIYKKDELLYGWYRAEEKVRETGIVFLTEGYKDTLAMHAAGFSNTVALCGTNLSEHHIAMIRKEAAAVCLFLDADEVGRETVTGVMPKLRSAGLRVVDILPGGSKDADEMFRSLGREAFIRWVEKAMIPPARRKAESLLVAACRRWPDTLCLTEEGEEIPYIDNILKILSSDDLLPADSLAPALDAGPQEHQPETEELDNLYTLHTDSSHSDRVRRSELVRYLFLCYLEVRLVDRIRFQVHHLSGAMRNEEEHTEILSSLQYHRNYLCEVSRELGRR
ncbi:CHC2 zinc finger domain-containing protein [Parabacteroides goldsteinii]|uniref:CHC2 zinc finger domain-containing protein n=2 Tax=Parabacteroides goldsteinii TaxID=328812 RepID=UPI0032191162